MNLTPSNIRRIAVTSLSVAVALIVTSIRSGAEAAPTQQQPADHGVWMIVSHKVENYKSWKPVHERSATTKQSYGWTKCAVFAIDGDQNHIMVMEQFASLERARAYAASNELRDEMAAGGVSSNPEIRFVKNLNGVVAP